MRKNNLILYCLLLFTFVRFCFADMQILKINKSHYIEATHNDDDDSIVCSKWSLNTKQIKKIFTLSERFKKGETMGYYWLWVPCEISGRLIYNNKEWFFSINAAATAEWSDGKDIIYWGCTKEECDSMFIMPYMGRGNPVY